MYDRRVIEVARTKRSWRPQVFGRRPARDIDDPLVEPLWTGIRVLAWVESGDAELIDTGGETVARGDISAAVGRATQASTAVLDGYITTEVARSDVGLAPLPDDATIGPGDMARQMLMGSGSDRSKTLEARSAEIEADARMAQTVLEGGEQAALVAIDLLELDGESLLDVPLLERRRLLDAVVAEEELVRIGIHVRPPIQPWLATWRMIGIRSIAFKAANSRYVPGEPNDSWASAAMPRR